MALADAGIPMKGMVAAVSMGRVDDKLVVDLDYSEESYEKGTVADIPIAIVSNTQEVSLLQMDGELSRDELKQAIEIVKKSCSKIDKIQRNALKERYEVKNE
jgi:exosome complex component RRP41